LGGKSYYAADKNEPPIIYEDAYGVLNTLSNGKVQTTRMPPIIPLLLAYAAELYDTLQRRYLTMLPQLSGDILHLQPAVLTAAGIHTRFDDSQTRLPPSQGGLGYDPPWSTLTGLCQLHSDHLIINAGKSAAELLAEAPMSRSIDSVELPKELISGSVGDLKLG
jgi:hypothetical protein